MTKQTKKSEAGEAKFMTIQAGVNPITVGSVPLSELSFRRENYRKMNAQQRETLRASTDSMGFQSFLVVVREPDGTYGIVDGHHRRDELESRGATTAPVILLPDNVDRKQADMGMFSFNVSAEIMDDKFGELVLKMLEDGADPEALRLHAGVSEDFMASIQEALAEPIPGSDGDLPREGTGSEKPQRQQKVPAIKVVMVFSRGEDGSLTPVAMTMTGKDTILSREVREGLEEQGMVIEELEPVWFASGDDLPGLIADLTSEEEPTD